MKYGVAQRESTPGVQEIQRKPDPETDGTATWSLQTLQRRLHMLPDGLPEVSTYTIWLVLLVAGYSWQQSRSCCETGQVTRKRKGRRVTQS